MASESGGRLRWQAWPARERPAVALTAAGFIVLVSVLFAGAGGHVLIGLGAVIILFGSLNPFFSPSTFTLDERGVTIERWPVRKVRAWSDVRAAYADRRGVTLSPFSTRSWLEPYRGVRLFFSGNRDEVLRAVRSYLAEGVELVEVGREVPERRGPGAAPGGGEET